MESFYVGFEKNAGFSDFFKKIKSFFVKKKEERKPIAPKTGLPFPEYERKPIQYFKRRAGDKNIVKALNKTIKLNKSNPDNTLTFKYRKANGEVVTRKVTPYSAKGERVLVGHDHFRDDIRSYRVDRIQKIN